LIRPGIGLKRKEIGPFMVLKRSPKKRKSSLFGGDANVKASIAGGEAGLDSSEANLGREYMDWDYIRRFCVFNQGSEADMKSEIGQEETYFIE
jgi:hypothetical protein